MRIYEKQGFVNDDLSHHNPSVQRWEGKQMVLKVIKIYLAMLLQRKGACRIHEITIELLKYR
jgi:hypothetical protein